VLVFAIVIIVVVVVIICIAAVSFFIFAVVVKAHFQFLGQVKVGLCIKYQAVER